MLNDVWNIIIQFCIKTNNVITVNKEISKTTLLFIKQKRSFNAILQSEGYYLFEQERVLKKLTLSLRKVNKKQYKQYIKLIRIYCKQNSLYIGNINSNEIGKMFYKYSIEGITNIPLKNYVVKTNKQYFNPVKLLNKQAICKVDENRKVYFNSNTKNLICKIKKLGYTKFKFDGDLFKETHIEKETYSYDKDINYLDHYHHELNENYELCSLTEDIALAG